MTGKIVELDFEQELYKYFGQVKDFTLGMRIAQRFYKLGKESQGQGCDDLEEEIIRYVGYPQEIDEDVSTTMVRKAARHFASWAKNHQEPVSSDFEEALAKEWKGYVDRGAATVDALEDNTQELAFAKGFYRGSLWQKQQMIKED